MSVSRSIRRRRAERDRNRLRAIMRQRLDRLDIETARREAEQRRHYVSWRDHAIAGFAILAIGALITLVAYVVLQGGL